MRAFVTGATGLVGRHLVRQLVANGWLVTAAIRESSNRSLIEFPGVQFYVCDLGRERIAADQLRGVDLVVHAAAAVTDWAPWPHFAANTIEATRNVCRGMIAAGSRRLIHISTVGVYGRPFTTHALAEDRPYASIGRWDYYTNSKIQAEQIVWDHQRHGPLDVTVLRPAMLYGVGDRSLIGRVIPLLRQRKILLVGDPSTPLPLVNVEDVVDAILRAASSEKATGEAFNVVNPEQVTQGDFFHAIAAHVGAPTVRHRVPYRLAYTAGLFAEMAGRARKSRQPPTITRYRVSLFGHRRTYSIDKIRTTLAWEPKISFHECIGQIVRAHLDREHDSG